MGFSLPDNFTTSTMASASSFFVAIEPYTKIIFGVLITALVLSVIIGLIKR